MLRSGEPISIEKINDDVKKYLKARDKLDYLLPLLDKQGTDPQEIKDANTFYQSREISFVFDKEEIEELFRQNSSANAIRAYYGSNPESKPTIILVACFIQYKEGVEAKDEDDSNVVKIVNIVTSDGGRQYPTRRNTKFTSKDFNIVMDDFPQH